jgi:molybdopterin-guanine dinucleotide biosynthesis protein A
VAAWAAAHGAWWTAEEPPGGGPVAGLAHGLATMPDADPVVAVAGDMPFAGPAIPRLVTALARADSGPGPDAAVGVDPAGRQQPLLAAYRADPLRSAVGAEPAGRALRDVLAALTCLAVPVSALEALDLDTPADLERALAFLAPEPRDMPGNSPEESR